MDIARLGNLIAEHRRALDMTQAELGKQMEVTDKAVSKWERGISAPDVSLMNRLAAVLRVSLDELLGERVADSESCNRRSEAEAGMAGLLTTPVRVTADDAAQEDVSPMMFGVNIEHTRSDVHNGLSAQMLRNRKFAGKPGACSGHAAEWYPIGERTLFAFGEPYTRHHELYHMKRKHERNSQRIVNAYEGSLCGLGQHELFIQEDRPYHFRMVARATLPVTVTVEITSRHGGVVYAAHEFAVQGDEWNTYEADMRCNVTDADADLRLTFTGRTALVLGALSLMPCDAFHGMRRDVVECLKEMGIRLLRWPGGNFAGEYNWFDGLLPLDMRAPLESCMGIETQPHSMGYDYHEINTDDFVALCREIGAEPFITINPCWNTPEESAAWVEYCNGDATTPYGRLRAERGHEQPYGVRLWSLGNEFGYGHMEGENTPEGYCRIARENASRMLEVSPDLRLCSSGPYPNAQWAKRCAGALSDIVPLVSQHYYAYAHASQLAPIEGPEGDNFSEEYYRCIECVGKLRSMIHENRRDLPDEVSISMDEWNVWYAWYRPSNVIDGVFAALTLHMLMSEAGPCGIGQVCHFEAVNEGLLCAAPDGAFLTAQGQAFRMMKHHVGGRILCRGMEAFATRKDGVTTVTVVNASYDQCRQTELCFGGEVLEARLLGGETVIPPSFFEERELSMERTDGGYACIMPPHSVMMVRLRG